MKSGEFFDLGKLKSKKTMTILNKKIYIYTFEEGEVASKKKL